MPTRPRLTGDCSAGGKLTRLVQATLATPWSGLDHALVLLTNFGEAPADFRRHLSTFGVVSTDLA